MFIVSLKIDIYESRGAFAIQQSNIRTLIILDEYSMNSKPKWISSDLLNNTDQIKVCIFDGRSKHGKDGIST